MRWCAEFWSLPNAGALAVQQVLQNQQLPGSPEMGAGFNLSSACVGLFSKRGHCVRGGLVEKLFSVDQFDILPFFISLINKLWCWYVLLAFPSFYLVADTSETGIQKFVNDMIRDRLSELVETECILMKVVCMQSISCFLVKYCLKILEWYFIKNYIFKDILIFKKENIRYNVSIHTFIILNYKIFIEE